MNVINPYNTADQYQSLSLSLSSTIPSSPSPISSFLSYEEHWVSGVCGFWGGWVTADFLIQVTHLVQEDDSNSPFISLPLTFFGTSAFFWRLTQTVKMTRSRHHFDNDIVLMFNQTSHSIVNNNLGS